MHLPTEWGRVRFQEGSEPYQKKYDYFKSKIHTAEDFIALAATKSELSGRPYFVRCQKGKEMPTANWLHEELQDYGKTTKDKSRAS